VHLAGLRLDLDGGDVGAEGEDGAGQLEAGFRLERRPLARIEARTQLPRGEERRRAADGDAAAGEGTHPLRDLERVAPANGDGARVEAELLGDDLRERRLVPLAVRGG